MVFAVSTLPAFAAHPHTAGNFFTEHHDSQPKFASSVLSDSELENRKIPDIRLLRTLPNVSAEARKEINRRYREWQNDTAELRGHLQLLQRQVARRQAEVQLRGGETLAAKNTSSSSDSQNLPAAAATVDQASNGNEKAVMESRAAATDLANQSETEKELARLSLQELRREQTDARNEIVSKRRELWEKVRPLLSDQNLQDLECICHQNRRLRIS